MLRKTATAYVVLLVFLFLRFLELTSLQHFFAALSQTSVWLYHDLHHFLLAPCEPFRQIREDKQ